MRTIIRGGRVIDPANRINAKRDLVLEGRKVAGIVEPGKDLPGKKSRKVKEIDATGCIVTPGFIDMHTHLREPGFEHKETIKTGTQAAVAGGFTSVVCMANTKPVNDNESVTGYILAKARAVGACKVYPVGAVTKEQMGESLTEMGSLKKAGAIALSDDGFCLQSSEVALRAFQYAAMFDLPILIHAEDSELAGQAGMNAGVVSMELGLSGSPAVAEEVMVARDMVLARSCNARVHIAHVSTAVAVDLIRVGRKRGVRVTCEATPHHFSLTEKDVGDYNTLNKVAPPLRTEQDREAIIAGLADGTINAIATDHAPHEQLMKDCEFDKAANGMIGLETALPLTLNLVRARRITMRRAVELLTCGPAGVLEIPGGTLTEGVLADVTVFNPNKKWIYTLDMIRSRSRNTPWINRTFVGKVTCCIVDGSVVYGG